MFAFTGLETQWKYSALQSRNPEPEPTEKHSGKANMFLDDIIILRLLSVSHLWIFKAASLFTVIRKWKLTPWLCKLIQKVEDRSMCQLQILVKISSIIASIISGGATILHWSLVWSLQWVSLNPHLISPNVNSQSIRFLGPTPLDSQSVFPKQKSAKR